MPADSLAGAGVLVTRPEALAGHLTHLIESAGGTAFRFPALEIGPAPDPGALKALRPRLGGFDLAIFVSRNAVEGALRYLAPLPTDLAVAAIGEGTARTLAQYGHREVIRPLSGVDSEALAGHPALSDLAGKRIVIFRGTEGRDVLADLLRARGATIEYAACYERLPPTWDPALLETPLLEGRIHIATATSKEGLSHLQARLGLDARARFLSLALVVLSERQAKAARELGHIGPILVTEGASDEAILAACAGWWRQAQRVIIPSG